MKNKRVLQVSLAKAEPSVTSEGSVPDPLDPDKISELVKIQVEHVAYTVGALLLAKKAADTLSELILITGRKYI